MKSNLSKPVFIMFVGQPGSGKSYLSRHLSKKLDVIHLDNTQIRNELFSKPTYSREEEGVVKHIMLMMAEKFMAYGLSVIYDGNAATKVERRTLRDFARKNKGTPLLIWQQVDDQTCAHRATAKSLSLIHI